MYKIIGGDQKEYGPVSADQVREWVLDGRANGQTQVMAEGTADWRPLASQPEFAAVLAAITPPPIPQWTPDASRMGEYRIDIASYLDRSWRMLNLNLRLFIRAALLVLLVSWLTDAFLAYYTKPASEVIDRGLANFSKAAQAGKFEEALQALQKEIRPEHTQMMLIAIFIAVVIQTLVDGGISLLMLKVIRGREATPADVFAGFGSPVLQLLLVGAVTWAFSTLGMFCLVLPGIYLSVIWMFAVPLVIDRKLNFWAAMELSRQRVHRRFLPVFCLWLVIALLGLGRMLLMFVIAASLGGGASSLGLQMVAFLASFVVVLATLPLIHGLRLFAYEDIFRA